MNTVTLLRRGQARRLLRLRCMAFFRTGLVAVGRSQQQQLVGRPVVSIGEYIPGERQQVAAGRDVDIWSSSWTSDGIDLFDRETIGSVCLLSKSQSCVGLVSGTSSLSSVQLPGVVQRG